MGKKEESRVEDRQEYCSKKYCIIQSAVKYWGDIRAFQFTGT
jgi:hypothetical protein